MLQPKQNFIRFNFISAPFFFPNRTKLKEFILKLLKKEGRTVCTINYVFCTDAYLLKLNQDYLEHNSYTDIITFELSKGQEPLVAEIFISVDRVRENAGLYGEGFLRELHRVIFHGALHLCGYMDKSPRQEKTMRAREDYYLNLFSSTWN